MITQIVNNKQQLDSAQATDKERQGKKSREREKQENPIFVYLDVLQ